MERSGQWRCRGRWGTAATVLLVLALLAAGCTADTDREEDATATPAAPDPESDPGTGTEDVTEDGTDHAEPSPSPSPSPVARLEDRYYVDSNGNGIPDFVEEDLGYDPAIDNCAREADCPGLSEVGDSPLLLEQNVLLILDSSGSMAGPDGLGNTKIDAAREALERYVVGTPDTFNLGLMVYGHRGSNQPEDRAESCEGIDVFAGLGELDPASASDVLAQFSPTGWTPLAESLNRAADVFTGREGQANRVVMVTDGIETCDGDAVAAAERLARAEIGVTVDVVGFDVADTAEEEALRQVAEITGGTYTTARNAEELNRFFDGLLGRQVSIVNALGCLLVNTSRVEVCAARLQSQANRVLTQEAIDAEDPERSRLLRELLALIAARTDAYRQQLREESTQRAEELRAALDEAQQRFSERYGEQVSAVLGPCPSFEALQGTKGLV